MATYCQVECPVSQRDRNREQNGLHVAWGGEEMVFPEHKEAPPLTHHHGLQTFFQLLFISQIHVSTILFKKKKKRRRKKFHGSCAMQMCPNDLNNH